MKILKSANEVLADIRAGTEEARGAIELQNAVLVLTAVGVIYAILLGAVALKESARRD